MRHGVVAAGLQDVEEPNEVTVDVGLGILDGVAHAGLRSEVDHDIEAILGKQVLDERRVAQVTAHEGEAVILVGIRQHAQANLLDAGVVVAVYVVQADDDVVGSLQKLLHQERADEAGGSGYEHPSVCH